MRADLLVDMWTTDRPASTRPDHGFRKVHGAPSGALLDLLGARDRALAMNAIGYFSWLYFGVPRESRSPVD